MLAAAAFALLSIQGLSPKELFQRSEPSVATIRVHGKDGNDYIGSGFVIKPHEVATCWHVVSDAETAEIEFANGKKWRASIQGAQPDLDIAILQYDGIEKPLPTRAEMPSPGEKLYALGAPDGLTGSICDGLMSQARQYGTRTVYQISNPVTFGNSGGPVLDEQGRVIGIVSFGLKGYASLNFAIPTSELLNISGDAPNPNLSSYQEKHQSGFHTFINKSKVGDLVYVTVNYHIVAAGKPTDIVDRLKQTVDAIKDGVETRTLTTLSESITANGKTQSVAAPAPKTVRLDRFFRTIGDEPADPTAKRVYRSNRYYPPETLGAVMKVGNTWSVELPADRGVPSATFTAKFVGFDDVEGVRCAHLKTLFQEDSGDHPISVAQDMFSVYGLELVKLDLYATNVPWASGYADMHESLNVTYWKHGPKPFSNPDRARGT